jgi:hypothetical protein
VNYFTKLSIAPQFDPSSDGIHTGNGMKRYRFFDITPPRQPEIHASEGKLISLEINSIPKG